MGRRNRTKVKHRKQRPEPHVASPPTAEVRPHWPPVVALGAPVAAREWILPRWLECLEAQTLRPTYLRFVYTPTGDATYRLLAEVGWADVRVAEYLAPYYSRDERNTDAKDPHRAAHFSVLRNQLRGLLLATDADVFVSCDTDILLEDPAVIERLVEAAYGPRRNDPHAPWAWDVLAPRTSFTPTTDQCYNAGRFVAGNPGDPKRVWERCTLDDVLSRRAPMQVHAAFGMFVAHRHVWGMCRYKPHEVGEDIGFADALEQKGMRVGWQHDIVVRHVWGPEYLEQAA